MLEEFISDANNHIKTIEIIKHEIEYFQLFHKKNITMICRMVDQFHYRIINNIWIIIFSELKEEMVRISRLSFNNGQPILLDSDDDFMGFDSVTVSKSVIFDE